MIDEAVRDARLIANVQETAYGPSISIANVATRIKAKSEEDGNDNIEESWRVIFGSSVGHLLDVSVSLEAPAMPDVITKLRFDYSRWTSILLD